MADLLSALVPMLLAVAVLTWAPVVADLRTEFESYRSVSVQRSPRHTDAFRPSVSGRPEYASVYGASPDRRHAPVLATRRVMPPVGARWEAAPTGGPQTSNAGPPCKSY